MPAIQSTATQRFVVNHGAAGDNVVTGSDPSNLLIPHPLVPPLTITPIMSANGLFASPGQTGNPNVVVWAPMSYKWVIQFEGSVRRICDPSSGRYWVNNENDVIPLSTSAPPPLTSFLVLGS